MQPLTHGVHFGAASIKILQSDKQPPEASIMITSVPAWPLDEVEIQTGERVIRHNEEALGRHVQAFISSNPPDVQETTALLTGIVDQYQRQGFLDQESAEAVRTTLSTGNALHFGPKEAWRTTHYVPKTPKKQTRLPASCEGVEPLPRPANRRFGGTLQGFASWASRAISALF